MQIPIPFEGPHVTSWALEVAGPAALVSGVTGCLAAAWKGRVGRVEGRTAHQERVGEGWPAVIDQRPEKGVKWCAWRAGQIAGG